MDSSSKLSALISELATVQQCAHCSFSILESSTVGISVSLSASTRCCVESVLWDLVISIRCALVFFSASFSNRATCLARVTASLFHSQSGDAPTILNFCSRRTTLSSISAKIETSCSLVQSLGTPVVISCNTKVYITVTSKQVKYCINNMSRLLKVVEQLEVN
ncbi:hypothetical protein CANCADRAFT_108496 [Tortispora caseinolytica NRRL Y-17796]|uniref:Uncharacterized protein n=1 Tax=Tortispora caseinolytica NRRL Y-17796 TaxID=767744 RepID=A0A1E4TFS0_9ASCO|nr:hypothetical protein CANCADRAFT_108496 [Tortispora caseinolytica NRRL Y-17796]